MTAANAHWVYAKTAKGVAEVANRGGALTLAARRVLIVIDGRRSIGELAALLHSALDEVVALLESQGFIARQGGHGPPTAGQAPAGDPQHDEPHEPLEVSTVGDVMSGADGRPPTLDEAKRRALRELHQRLASATNVMAAREEQALVAIRLQQARTADEFREGLREAEKLIASFVGAAAAGDYLRALRRR